MGREDPLRHVRRFAGNGILQVPVVNPLLPVKASRSILVEHRLGIVPAKAHVQGQARTETEIILRVEGKDIVNQAGAGVTGAAAGGGGNPQQEAGETIAAGSSQTSCAEGGERRAP